MDKLDAILSDIAARGIDLWVESGQLKFAGPAGAMDPILSAKLAANRNLLIARCPWHRTPEGGKVFLQKVPAYMRPRLLRAARNELGPAFTNETNIAVSIEQQISLPILAEAIDRLLKRHRILTARIVVSEGTPVFTLYEDHGIILETHTVRSDSVAYLEQKAKDVVHEALWRPFEQPQNPLVRFFSVTLKPERHIVGLAIHHFIADLVSVQILTAELFMIYGTLTKDPSAEIPPKGWGYCEHLESESRWLSEQEDAGFPALTAHCEQYLQDIKPTWLKRRNPPGRFDNLEVYEFSIDQSLAQQVRAIAVSRGRLLFFILLFANARAISEVANQEDVTVFVIYSCRTSKQLREMVGFLTNVLHCRFQFPREGALSSQLDATIRSFSAAAKMHRYPVETVEKRLEELGQRPERPYAPMFNFVDAIGGVGGSDPAGPESMALTAGSRPPEPIGEQFATHYLRIVNSLDGFHVRIRYSPVEYEKATLDEYSKALTRLLQQLVRG